MAASLGASLAELASAVQRREVKGSELESSQRTAVHSL
jgi:hypothetical protein